MVATVQTGTTVLAANAATATQAITTVVLANAYVTMTYSANETSSGEGSLTCHLSDVAEITFARTVSTGAPEITIRWYVVEDPEITVQRGVADVATDPVNVTITEVVLANAFTINYTRRSGNNWGADDWCTSTLTTTTNLAIGCTGAATGVTCEWQVVEHPRCNVQRGTLPFGTTDAELTDALTAVVIGKSLPLFSFVSGDGTTANIGQKMFRVVLTDAETLTFTREATGQAMSISWELVEFTDDTRVHYVPVAFGTGDTSQDDAVPPVALARAWPVAPGHKNCGGSNTYAADDNPGVGMATLELTTPINLQSVRALTGSVAATLAAYVVEFPLDPDEMAVVARQLGAIQPVQMPAQIIAY